VAVVAAAVALSFTGILYIAAGASPSTASAYRCLLVVPFLVVLARSEDRAVGPRPWAVRRWALLAGVFFAADLILFHHSIGLMGAGLATVMSNLQVVIVLVVTWIVLRERPTRPQLVGVPLALAGVVLISGVLGGAVYGRDPQAGVLVGLLVAASYAAYLMLIRKGRDRTHVAGPILDATIACGVSSVLAGLAVGDFQVWPGAASMGWLFLMGLGSQLAAGLLVAIALPRLPAVTTSLLLLVQPMLSVLLAMLLVDERPSPGQLAGVGLLLLGVTLGSLPLGRLASRLRVARGLAGVARRPTSPAAGPGEALGRAESGDDARRR
jgi:drug/metabolite transporter (DMT)-like permease